MNKPVMFELENGSYINLVYLVAFDADEIYVGGLPPMGPTEDDYQRLCHYFATGELIDPRVWMNSTKLHTPKEGNDAEAC